MPISGCRFTPAPLVAEAAMRVWRLFAVAATVAACEPYANTVSLAPTTSADSIHFRITGPGGPASGVFGLSVVRCGTESSQWTIATDGSKPMPQNVTFGQPVPGFDVRTPAHHLGPGCYDVLVSGARPLRINVGHDGTVTSGR